MTVNIDSPLYFNSGEISFQNLKNTFGGGGDAQGKNIKFSNFIRNTTETTNPLVPDSTENADIASSKKNLSVETFRDSNKYYHVKFTGTEAQKEFVSYFNNNLTKNIPKKLNIGSEDGNESGVLVSGDISKYAATLTLTGNIRNMDMNVNSRGTIYGAAGAAGGGNGGGALYLNTGDSSRNFNFNIKTGGKVWAGGGGGSKGTGASSRSVRCTFTDIRHKYRNASVPPNRHWEPARSVGVTVYSGHGGRGCGEKNRGTAIPGPGPGYTTSGGPMRGWASTSGRGGGGRCYNSYLVTYHGYNYDVAQPNRSQIVQVDEVQPARQLTVPAGVGGAGGPGQGWIGGVTGSIQNASPGVPGSGGGTADCATRRYTYGPGSKNASMGSKVGTQVSWSGGSTTVSAGNPGGAGGEWGKKAGGEAGTAIKHNGGIRFSGTGNATKLKGRFSN